MSFKVDDSSFAFLNCHLASGDGQVTKRIEMLNLILDQSFAKAKGLLKATQHHYVFVFGDLNFRVDFNRDKVKRAIASNDVELLKENDELIRMRNRVYNNSPKTIKELKNNKDL